jgi:1,4-dihydroxy-2-naphthoate octaprenyltransferase
MMDEPTPNPIVLYLRLVRPLFLVGGILLYALGVGIARYLGIDIDWGVYILGQFWVTVLQLSAQFLNEYFDAPGDLINQNRTILTGGSGALGPGKLPRQVALWSGLGCLVVLTFVTIVMISQIVLPPVAVLIMLLAFLGAILYSTPPVWLAASGYGELTTSTMISFLLPAFAFVLQTGDLHRLLTMVGFPLTGLQMAMLISFEMPDYAADIKFNKRTLLVRLGWQMGMSLHNILLLTSFFLLAAAIRFGMPVMIVLPAMIPLALALLQIWMMRRIAAGAKPNWNALTINALAIYVAVAYLLAFAFWTR